MAQKAEYKTRQHDELIAYMQSVPGRHFTAGQVVAHFRSCGSTMGTATIYRQLEKMVSAGLVTKYIIDANSPACFEYVGSHEPDEVCYHCKCQQCGKLVHMHCDALPELQKHVLEHHGFTIDPVRTVFYGLCRECAEGTRP